MNKEIEQQIDMRLWMFAAETLEAKVLLQDAVPATRESMIQLLEKLQAQDVQPKKTGTEQDIFSTIYADIGNTIHPGTTDEQRFLIVQAYLEELCNEVYAHYGIFQTTTPKS